jgi:hypothetical protein
VLPRGFVLAVAGITVAVFGGCSLASPTRAPSPPTIRAIGILADVQISDPDRTYILDDGRTFDVSTRTTRLLFDGGPGQPFVLGTDGAGQFVAVFAHQDGLPEGCYIPGIGAHAIERGAYVEIGGVLWQKAPTFQSPVALPGLGASFDTSLRFCFDEQAQVTSIVP